MKYKIMFIAAGALGAAMLAAPLAASAATSATVGGQTRVALDPGFLGLLKSVPITPAAIGPAQINVRKGTVVASFPITTGQVESPTSGEIDHSGGLSLTKGGTTVELTSFAIDLNRGRLTGLVVAGGHFVGRVDLFDLSLASASVSAKYEVLKVKGVTLTLDLAAAQALDGVFGLGTALESSLPVIGIADVSALIGEAGHSDEE